MFCVEKQKNKTDDQTIEKMNAFIDKKLAEFDSSPASFIYKPYYLFNSNNLDNQTIKENVILDITNTIKLNYKEIENIIFCTELDVDEKINLFREKVAALPIIMLTSVHSDSLMYVYDRKIQREGIFELSNINKKDYTKLPIYKLNTLIKNSNTNDKINGHYNTQKDQASCLMIAIFSAIKAFENQDYFINILEKNPDKNIYEPNTALLEFFQEPAFFGSRNNFNDQGSDDDKDTIITKNRAIGVNLLRQKGFSVGHVSNNETNLSSAYYSVFFYFMYQFYKKYNAPLMDIHKKKIANKVKEYLEKHKFSRFCGIQ